MRIGITFRVEPDETGLRDALRLLVTENLRYLRAHPKTPHPYAAGIRYKLERRGKEEWLSIPDILERRIADCEDLSAYLAAWMIFHGKPAWPVLTRKGRIWHVRVNTRKGIIDPSRVLGMKG